MSRLEKMRRKTRRVLFIEKFWHIFRWSFLCICLWMLGSIFHLPQYFSDMIRFFIEAALLSFLFYSLFYAIKKTPTSTIAEIDRRLEEDSDLPFHPLTTLGDKPALTQNNIDANILHRRLWEKHCERISKSLKTLRVSPPKLFPTKAAKSVLFVFTVISVNALLQNQNSLQTRFLSAVLPWTDDDQTPLPHLQAWIERPHYAPGPPVFLHLSGPAPKDILPEGSIIHILLTDIATKPTLIGVNDPKIEHFSEESWQITATLTESTTLKIHARGRNISYWPLKILEDSAPQIAWNGAITHNDHLETLLPWKAEQIFGLKKVSLLLTSPYKNAENKEQIFEFPLDFNHSQTKFTEKSILDLSSHPLAGLTVQAQLKAESLSGKISYSEKRKIFLARHPFHHALSRALIGLRQRDALSLAPNHESSSNLLMLLEATKSDIIRFPMAVLLREFSQNNAREERDESLWYLALYDEDLETYDAETASMMAEIRSIAKDIEIILTNKSQEQDFIQEEKLHKKLENLQTSLQKRLSLIFAKSNNPALIFPNISGSSSPWHTLSKKIEKENALHHPEEAKRALHELVMMAEEMRFVTQNDLEQVSLQMKMENEKMSQKAALRHLIKEETNLFNHSQLRFTHETTKAHKIFNPDSSETMNNLSTAELLRGLGMRVPPNLEDKPHAAKTDKDADPSLVLSYGDERQQDFALQNGLKTLDDILSQRAEKNLNYHNKALLQAKDDMGTALKALAHQKDNEAHLAEEKVLKDLADALKEMQKKDQQDKNKKTKKMSLMMPPNPSSHSGENHSGSSQGEGNGQDENGNSQMSPSSQDPDSDLDKDSDYQDQHKGGESEDEDGEKKSAAGHKGQERDPLGRPKHPEESDAHIPAQDNNDQRRKIEEELRKRASDQTRSQQELNYLNRLLSPFKEGK